MISVVSPPFIRSGACRCEVEEFWRIAGQTGGQWVEDKARLLKVFKTAVSDEDLPPALADIFSPLLGFEFFELDPQTGRIREFDETFGAALKQRFFERVYDLAHDVCQILKALRQARARQTAIPESEVTGQWVYLATTTTDVQDERDRVPRDDRARSRRPARCSAALAVARRRIGGPGVPGEVHNRDSPAGAALRRDPGRLVRIESLVQIQRRPLDLRQILSDFQLTFRIKMVSNECKSA